MRMIQDWIEENYTFKAAQGVWLRQGHDEFAYSDGDAVEKAIYKRVLIAKDRSVSSDELFATCDDWPSLYHLSPERSNLLRPFGDFLQGKRVLELGCGCGAITRFLGEAGADVLALEGSFRRASIAAARCEGLENVTVLCDKILEAPIQSQKFDVVTLIGVLEYARMFSESEDPIAETLRMARSLLNPGGCLLLAIENRFGLKYFAGAREDHLGTAMDGIEGGYRPKGPVTFSRKVLERYLKECGFAQSELHLPLPDYKLPRAMIHPAGIDDENFAAEALLTDVAARDYSRFEQYVFSAPAAWPGLHEAGLTRDLANSFLFVAWADEVQPCLSDGVLAEYYGEFMLRETQKVVQFVKDNDAYQVRRQPLSPPAKRLRSLRGFRHVLEDEPYFRGETMQAHLTHAISMSGWTIQDIVEALRPWVELLKEHSVERDGKAYIPGKFYDLIPCNAILVDGKATAIDQEWISQEELLPLSYMVLRGLSISLIRQHLVGVPQKGTPLRFEEIFKAFMSALNLSYDRKEIEECWNCEKVLQANFGNRCRSFQQYCTLELNPRVDLTSALAALEQEQKRSVELFKANKELKQSLRELMKAQ